jgi:hypothetical protein
METATSMRNPRRLSKAGVHTKTEYKARGLRLKLRCLNLRFRRGELLPFLGRIPRGGCRAAEILLGEKRANFVHGEHGLLRPQHVGTFGICLGRHDLLKIGSHVGDDGFGLRTVAAMKVDDEIPNAGKYVR